MHCTPRSFHRNACVFTAMDLMYLILYTLTVMYFCIDIDPPMQQERQGLHGE